MDPMLADLLGLLRLEQIEVNIYRGESRDIGSPQVFGGQVLGQALSAASRTVEGRLVHSLHAYFLRRGDVNAPIVYEVDPARDGASFSNRRVVAIQHGRQIFNMTASFQVREDGLEHQATMPEVPDPESLRDIGDVPAKRLASLSPRMREFLTRRRPFHVRPVRRADAPDPGPMEPAKHVWMRAVDPVPDDPVLHSSLLAYLSDYELLGTATLPHGVRFVDGQVQMASLDHAMWFHRSCRLDDWLLFSFDSPSASGARGLARGQVFRRDGTLVASTAQEGLIRPRKPV
ncbi:MAG: acyl-CoA thioesterase II [Chromatiales bacterium]|nr:acyl-CoA thioesterase II [Chromatiales bacterium]